MAKLKYGYIKAQNVSRSVEFYNQVLQLKLKFQDGERWAQFDANGVDLAIASPAETAEGAQGAVLVFEVDDLDAAAERVRLAGGKIGTLRDMGAHGRALPFTDMDGNVVQLFQKAKK
jgi:predicted enzyme related to lactoylglutathione lyase